MRFLDRESELERLDSLLGIDGGLGVVYGRRRVGKTRLLLEWCRRHDGLYTVADQSSAEVQRRYFATALEPALAGFSRVDYPDWRALLARLAADAARIGWRGPLVLDELPYLVRAAPELPSVLQHWIDHEARAARLVVAVAGSSQRMMHGIVLDASAPLFGRAREIFRVEPLGVEWVPLAFGVRDPRRIVECFAAWGGIPRYWELAVDAGETRDALDRLMLDPSGPLHREPDRLLVEELPSAADLRPLLDAIGMGAHRLSEIAGRVGSAATALSRPLHRLQDMGLVRREVPFGELEKRTRRSLYRIDDPFVRLWFRLVAPHRGRLAAAPRRDRIRLLDAVWAAHVSSVWEDLCRAATPWISPPGGAALGPGRRWWKGSAPEWDVVAEDAEAGLLFLGEVKWTQRPVTARRLEQLVDSVASRPAPVLSGRAQSFEQVRALFVPDLAPGARRPRGGVLVLTAKEMLTKR